MVLSKTMQSITHQHCEDCTDTGSIYPCRRLVSTGQSSNGHSLTILRGEHSAHLTSLQSHRCSPGRPRPSRHPSQECRSRGPGRRTPCHHPGQVPGLRSRRSDRGFLLPPQDCTATKTLLRLPGRCPRAGPRRRISNLRAAGTGRGAAEMLRAGGRHAPAAAA